MLSYGGFSRQLLSKGVSHSMLRTLKYEFIRTPLEQPLMAIREMLGIPHRLRHPELAEIYKEDARIKQVLKRSLRVDSNCLDIGTHYGSMLSAFLRLAPKGQHVAVEAVPEKTAFLRRKFPEVCVYPLALSDHRGIASFYINTRRSGFSGMAKHGAPKDSFRRIEVSCNTLDNIMPRHQYIDFLKIDVEGAEEMVLAGGRNFIAECKPLILFECGPSGPKAFGRTPSDLFHLIVNGLDYRIYFLKDFLLSGPPMDVDSFEAALVYPFKAFNWIAKPRRGARSVAAYPPSGSQ